MGTDPSTAVDATRRVGGVFGGLFTGSAWLSTFMAFLHMTSALLMVQALILMAIYMLLPLIVLLSGYKLEVMFYGAMAIFTVKFWTVLWFIAQWGRFQPGQRHVPVANPAGPGHALFSGISREKDDPGHPAVRDVCGVPADLVGNDDLGWDKGRRCSVRYDEQQCTPCKK